MKQCTSLAGVSKARVNLLGPAGSLHTTLPFNTANVLMRFLLLTARNEIDLDGGIFTLAIDDSSAEQSVNAPCRSSLMGSVELF